jgi:hypothetical protein
MLFYPVRVLIWDPVGLFKTHDVCVVKLIIKLGAERSCHCCPCGRRLLSS